MSNYLVALDAGHGGNDSGAVGGLKEILEKDVVLSICRLIMAHNAEIDTEIDFAEIRGDDINIPLHERASMANELNADIFVSVHANGAKSDQANGLETFHFPGSTEGAKLASHIQEHMLGRTRRRDRGVKTARFAVLRLTNMPAVLVETGFLTNPEEEKLLSECEYQYLIASAILGGIKSYYSLLK